MKGRKASRSRPSSEQVVRRGVGGRDHHHAAREQRLEQPAEDHGVGDVVHLEFVEAQQRGLSAIASATGGTGSSSLISPCFFSGARHGCGVHVLHEWWKCTRRFLRQRRGLEEQVHQHGLAAADLAPDVEPARRGHRLAAEQPAQRRGFLRQMIDRELPRQGVEPFGHRLLRDVVFDLAVVDEGLVAFKTGGVHRRCRVGSVSWSSS